MNPMPNSDTQQLQLLSEDWAAAERQGDTTFFQRILTDDFVGVGPLGFMLSKSDSIQRFTSGNFKYESFSWDDVKIRNCGDAAVMVGRQTQKAQYQDLTVTGIFLIALLLSSGIENAVSRRSRGRAAGYVGASTAPEVGSAYMHLGGAFL